MIPVGCVLWLFSLILNILAGCVLWLFSLDLRIPVADKPYWIIQSHVSSPYEKCIVLFGTLSAVTSLAA
jgi:hypothetical protein